MYQPGHQHSTRWSLRLLPWAWVMKSASPAFRAVGINSNRWGIKGRWKSLFELEMYCGPERQVRSLREWGNNWLATPSQCAPLPTRIQIPNDIQKGNTLASQDPLQRPNAVSVSRSCGSNVSSSKEAVINSRSSYSRPLQQSKETSVQKQMFCSRWYKQTRSEIARPNTLFSPETDA